MAAAANLGKHLRQSAPCPLARPSRPTDPALSVAASRDKTLLARVTWDDALGSHRPSQFRPVLATHGPQAVAFYGAAGCISIQKGLPIWPVQGLQGLSRLQQHRFQQPALHGGCGRGLPHQPRQPMPLPVATRTSITPSVVHRSIWQQHGRSASGDLSTGCVPRKKQDRSDADRRRGSAADAEAAAIADLHLPIRPARDIAFLNAVGRSSPRSPGRCRRSSFIDTLDSVISSEYREFLSRSRCRQIGPRNLRT